MATILLSTAIRIIVVADFIGPPTRSQEEVWDDNIEACIRGGWALCGNTELYERIERVEKRMAERDPEFARRLKYANGLKRLTPSQKRR